jgi:hypothetical protein
MGVCREIASRRKVREDRAAGRVAEKKNAGRWATGGG